MNSMASQFENPAKTLVWDRERLKNIIVLGGWVFANLFSLLFNAKYSVQIERQINI